MSLTLNRWSCRASAHTTLVWSPPAGCSGHTCWNIWYPGIMTFYQWMGSSETPISTCPSYTRGRNCGCINKHRTGRIRSRLACSGYSLISLSFLWDPYGSTEGVSVLWPHYWTRCFLHYLRTQDPWTSKDSYGMDKIRIDSLIGVLSFSQNNYYLRRKLWIQLTNSLPINWTFSRIIQRTSKFRFHPLLK